jgi:hypothetical protein
MRTKRLRWKKYGCRVDEREAKITILLALLVPEATLVTSGRQGVATWSKILAVRESGVASAAIRPHQA